MMLSLHRAERPGFRHLGLRISGAGPLDDALAELRSAGIDAEIRSDPLHGVRSAIDLADPDGHRIYLYRDETTAALRFPTRGICPEKLGHIALMVADARRSERFYDDTLGFRTSATTSARKGCGSSGDPVATGRATTFTRITGIRSATSSSFSPSSTS